VPRQESRRAAGRSPTAASYGQREEPSGEYSQFASNMLPVLFLLLRCNQAGRGCRVCSSASGVSRVLPCSLFPLFFSPLLYPHGDLEAKCLGDLDFLTSSGAAAAAAAAGRHLVPGACACTSVSGRGLPSDVPPLLPACTIAEVRGSSLLFQLAFLYSVTRSSAHNPCDFYTNVVKLTVVRYFH